MLFQLLLLLRTSDISGGWVGNAIGIGPNRWIKMIWPQRKRFRVLVLSTILLCVVRSSESSPAASVSENDDVKIDAAAAAVDTDIAADTNPANDDIDASRNNESNVVETNAREDVTLDRNAEDDSGDGGRLRYEPPTHFQITAHVQTDLRTGLSYFLPPASLPASFAHLPFLECGAVGSTTEGLPLVSGVFRHVPHTVVPPREDGALDAVDVVLDNLGRAGEEEGGRAPGSDLLEGGDGGSVGEGDDHPKRPSPPKYVVALSSMEITVGGNGNETRAFDSGDVIFVEDTWWGVWDDDDLVGEDGNHENTDDGEGASTEHRSKMKGYIMRASPDSQVDLNVLMLTVPNAIHRHWKNAQYAMAVANREITQGAKRQHANEYGTRRPWWKLTSKFMQTHDNPAIPKPCSLEPDPAFAHPATSSTTLSQHFTQHFTNLLRRSSNPHPSFLPHHHQDLLLPVLSQAFAALAGGAAGLALVLRLFRVVPGPVAMGFGSACLLAMGTAGFVWLGEEALDQWELWRERRRLERMMGEGWGRGGASTAGGLGGAN